MRKNILVGLGLALSLAGTVGAQQTEQPRHDRGDQRGPGMRGEGRRGTPDGQLLKGIDLNEGQRAQIAQLRKTHYDAMDPNRGAKRGAQMDELRAARQRGDTAAVRVIMQRHRQAMELERAQYIAAIRNILTVEQRVRFDRNVVELREREAKRAERGHQDDKYDKGSKGKKGGKGNKGDKPGRSDR